MRIWKKRKSEIFLTEYSNEIQKMKLESPDESLSDTERTWRALTKTAGSINKELDLEL